jgi:hypothetical protein
VLGEALGRQVRNTSIASCSFIFLTCLRQDRVSQSAGAGFGQAGEDRSKQLHIAYAYGRHCVRLLGQALGRQVRSGPMQLISLDKPVAGR